MQNFIQLLENCSSIRKFHGKDEFVCRVRSLLPTHEFYFMAVNDFNDFSTIVLQNDKNYLCTLYI